MADRKDNPFAKSVAEAADAAKSLAAQLARARYPQTLPTPNLYPTSPTAKETRRY